MMFFFYRFMRISQGSFRRFAQKSSHLFIKRQVRKLWTKVCCSPYLSAHSSLAIDGSQLLTVEKKKSSTKEKENSRCYGDVQNGCDFTATLTIQKRSELPFLFRKKRVFPRKVQIIIFNQFSDHQNSNVRELESVEQRWHAQQRTYGLSIVIE